MSIILTDDIPTFTGSAIAKPSGVGALVRTRKLALVSYTATGKNTISLGSPSGSVVFDGSYFVMLNNQGGGNGSAYTTNSTVFTNGGNIGADLWLNNCRITTDGAGTCMAAGSTVGVAKIYKTINHGASWVLTGNLPVSSDWCVAIYGDYGGGRWVAFGNASTPTAYSINGGTSWTAGGTLPFSNYSGFAYGNGIYIITSQVGSHTISLDGGVTWSGAITPPYGRGYVAFNPVDGLFYFGNDWHGVCGFTKDGVNFTQLASNYFPNPIYVGTANGIVGLTGADGYFISDVRSLRLTSADWALGAYGLGIYWQVASYAGYSNTGFTPNYLTVTE